MVQIKNGKMHFAGVAIALPENFFVESFDETAFRFHDGAGTYIQAGVEESPATVEEILLDDVGENKAYRAIKAPFALQRANRQGKAIFAQRTDGGDAYYEERFEMKSGVHFYIVVEGAYDVSGGLETFLSKPQIRDFLESVE